MSATTDAAQFAVGIDLGTTHCALAWARLERPTVRLMEIPQLVAPGEIAAAPLLPSFMYLAAPGELTAADRTLPWGEAEFVVGEAARRLGAKVPGRLVASAKSWVCHGGVDRRAPILPWNAPDSEPHVSPFTAQVEYLAHLRAAFEHANPGVRLRDQDVVVTVPASFDEGARELTGAAAHEAGLGAVRLLEEPQAAFYDWLGVHGDTLGAQLGDARLVLVVDVGGGTTDLTLLRVLDPEHEGGQPRIERIAVGGHLMLGGDNMDAALAMFALTKAGLERPEDATVWSALVQSARQAKERLLGASAATTAVLSVQSRGSRLVGGTKSITIDRDEATAVLLDGFLPYSGPADTAGRVGRAGLTTLGLPYTTDTAIGRHVCTFLRRHADAAAQAGARVVDGLPRPDRVLLNGGVFNGAAMTQRLLAVLAGWFDGVAPIQLEHTSLDLAVAHGAVRSALARRGVGEVITGGTARAYYIGVAAADGGHRALCVAPRGMAPGSTVAVSDRIFDLVLDQPVSFPLFEYTGDLEAGAGTLADDALELELEPLPPLETLLRDPTRQAGHEGSATTVTLSATVTESGALELYLVTVALPPRRWRLDFALHRSAPEPAPSAGASPPTQPPDPATKAAVATLAAALEGRGDAALEGLRAAIEALLGPRGRWSAATCRVLADACLHHAAACARSELHELNWLRLVGWCLRPGFGMPGDEARIDAMWQVREVGLHHRGKAMWAEWWIVWRRIAAGLSAPRQRALWDELRPWLLRAADGSTPKGPHRHGPVEMMQLAAALEGCDADARVALGELLFERADKLGSYWPLGRVGARAPFRLDDAAIVAPAIAEAWLGRLLALDLATAEGAAFAIAQLGRMTGDPDRDVSAATRQAVVAALTKHRAPASWVEMVLRPQELSIGDRGRLLGDALPAGLRLT